MPYLETYKLSYIFIRREEKAENQALGMIIRAEKFQRSSLNPGKSSYQDQSSDLEELVPKGQGYSPMVRSLCQKDWILRLDMETSELMSSKEMMTVSCVLLELCLLLLIIFPGEKTIQNPEGAIQSKLSETTTQMKPI